MAFKALIEQIDLANGLKKIKSTLGKGKNATQGTVSTDNLVYMEVVQHPTKNILALKLITNNGNELTECLTEVINGEIGVSTLIEYDKLVNMINTIDPTIEIKMASDDSKLLLDYVGRVKPIILNGADPTLFLMPPDVQVQDTITVPLAALKEGIDAISPLITDSQARPLYNCINIEIKNGKILFGGLDAALSRIMYYTKDITHTNDGKFFVECNKLKKMISAFDTINDIDILISGNNLALKQDDTKQSMRLMSGSFPDVISIIKTQYVIEADIIKDDILIAIERAKVITETSSVTGKSIILNFDENMITINLNSHLGFLFETVPCTLKGKPFSMAFNIDSIYEALNLVKDSQIKMGFASRSGCVLSPVAPTDFEQLIFVPAVRISNGEV